MEKINQDMPNQKLTSLISFEELIKTTLTTAQFEQLADDLGSKTIRTQLLNNPAKAKNEQLIIISKALNIPVWELYDKYGVGIAGISPTVAEYHQSVYLENHG